MAIGPNSFPIEYKKMTPKIEMSKKKLLKKNRRRIMKLDKYNAYQESF